MDWQKPIEDFPLVFVDLETTGLKAEEGEEICEIGALKVKNRTVIDRFHSLVNPQREIPQTTYLIHHISNATVKDAPVFAKIADAFVNFIDPAHSVVCAYNIAFDFSFINTALEKNNLPLLQTTAIDILRMARKSVNAARYNLGAMASFLNIDCPDKLHRAMQDVDIASKIFFKLSDLLKDKGVTQLKDFIVLFGLNNAIYQLAKGPQANLIKKAIIAKTYLKIRYLSYSNTLEEFKIIPFDFSSENKNFYIWHRTPNDQARRINFNYVLDVQEL